MNKQELIGKIRALSYEEGVAVDTLKINRDGLIKLIEQFDEPQSIKSKDVIARIKELDLGAREVWLNEILNELGSDYGSLKYRAGYEQGRFDGAMEREKVTVPQIVADYIKYTKDADWDLQEAMDNIAYEDNNELLKWFNNNIDTFALAWINGYTVEKEKRYTVKIKANLGQYLERYYLNNEELTPQFKRTKPTGSDELPTFTRKELEEANFGWVFDCPGIEIEEVE